MFHVDITVGLFIICLSYLFYNDLFDFYEGLKKKKYNTIDLPIEIQ